MKKNILKIVACVCVIAIIAVCFTACGKIYATDLKISTSELTVKAGETAFYAVVANYEDVEEGELVLDMDTTDKDGKITESLQVATPTESSTWISVDENDIENTVTNLDIGDGVYLGITDDYAGALTVDALGDDLIKFINDNCNEGGSQAFSIICVKGLAAGTETQTYTSGDQTVTVTITVTE